MKRKNYQKIANILFIIGTVLICFCGCGSEAQKSVVGDELVAEAKKELSQLHSGKITVTNNETGEVEQEMLFRYDEVGILLYSVVGVEDGKPYEQYSNGYRTYILRDGKLDLSNKGDADFVMFTYEVRHPMTDEEYLFFSAENITSAEMTELDDGTTSYTYRYEPSALGGDASQGEMTELSMTFYFDKNNKLASVDEISAFENNGVVTRNNYRITITKRDSVDKIPVPDGISKMLENDKS